MSRRLTGIRFAALGGFAAVVMASLPLWVSGGVYPRAPLLEFLSPLAGPVGDVVFLVLALALIASCFEKAMRVALPIACVSALLLVAGDRMRVQPFVFQHIGIFAVLAWIGAARSDTGGDSRYDSRATTGLRALMLIHASIYVFAGLWKATPGFWSGTWPALLAPVFGLDDPSDPPAAIVMSGVAIMVFEIWIGIGLLRPSWRRAALWGATLMHAGIPILLGLFHEGYDLGVYPWNAGMVALGWTIFGRSHERIGPREVTSGGPVVWSIVLCFWLLPLLHGFGLWHANLSFSLYSGNNDRATLFVSRDRASRMPASPLEHGRFYERPPERGLELMRALPAGLIDPARHLYLDIDHWALDEYRQTVPPEGSAYRGIARELCRGEIDPRGVILLIEPKASLFAGLASFHVYSCAEEIVLPLPSPRW